MSATSGQREQLYTAVGRVAVESAGTERLLRALVDRFIDNSAVEVLTARQPDSYLVDRCKEMLSGAIEWDDAQAEDYDEYLLALG